MPKKWVRWFWTRPEIDHPMFKGIKCHTPVIIKVDGKDVEKYSEEVFGPIVFVIATEDTQGQY